MCSNIRQLFIINFALAYVFLNIIEILFEKLPDSVAEGNRNQHTYVQTFSFKSNGQNEGKC